MLGFWRSLGGLRGWVESFLHAQRFHRDACSWVWRRVLGMLAQGFYGEPIVMQRCLEDPFRRAHGFHGDY